ncbi:MAG: glycosyltransferase family 39 protein [Patescibacteria group bacterium]
MMTIFEMFSGRIAACAVFAVLAVMCVIMLSTSAEESAIMDELAHIPAGYSYLAYQDMRINPEHPPLLKDISAIPLLFLDLNFPETSTAWTSDVNGQWELGREFLYKSGNDPDTIVYWARVGPIILTLLFGWLLYRFGREFFGAKVAFIALILFAFSPALLAHGKYVTTDTVAGLGFLIGIFYFLRFLRAPSRSTLVAAGVAFGIAQALKFSLVLLIPFLLGIAVMWAWSSHAAEPWRARLAASWKYILRTIGIFIIGYAVIVWPLYQLHVWNYPAAPAHDAARAQILAAKSCDDLPLADIGVNQFRDTVCNLKGFRVKPLANLIIWMSDKPVLRPFAQYATGVFMVGKRAVGGNTTYFMGEVSRDSWRSYFPIVYLIKEPLAVHILNFAALAALLFVAPWRKIFTRSGRQPRMAPLLAWTHRHFAAITALLFILFYWTISMAANLNIGVRHIIPSFPFIFLVVAYVLFARLDEHMATSIAAFFSMAKTAARAAAGLLARYAVLVALVAWYVLAATANYPYYISYFNELAGGTQNGWQYVADSNADWGQDMKRLAVFTRTHAIDTIRVGYFGGGSPEYYLGDAYVPWWSARGAEPGWYAISATFLDEGFGMPVGRYERKPEDSYLWLRDKTPVALIGGSILVYHLK